MDFEYTPEQIHLRKAVREFAEAEIAPHVMEWDEAQTFPLEVIRKLGKLGYMGAIFPEELGGAGMGYIEYSIIIEELSRVDGSVGIIVAAHTSLCSNHIFKMGTRRAAEALPSQAGYRASGSAAGRSPSPRRARDAAGTRTHGRTARTACWVLNGAEDVHHQRALRRCLRGHGGDGSGRGAARHLGIRRSKRARRDSACGKKENKLGLRASATGEVIFENCRLAPRRSCSAS